MCKFINSSQQPQESKWETLTIWNFSLGLKFPGTIQLQDKESVEHGNDEIKLVVESKSQWIGPNVCIYNRLITNKKKIPYPFGREKISRNDLIVNSPHLDGLWAELVGLQHIPV